MPLFAFQAAPTDESLVLNSVALRLELGAGTRAADIESLHLWRDRGAIGQLDLSDERLAVTAVVADSLARFDELADTLHAMSSYLVTWNARSTLAAGWKLASRLAPETSSSIAPAPAACKRPSPAISSMAHNIWSAIPASPTTSS